MRRSRSGAHGPCWDAVRGARTGLRRGGAAHGPAHAGWRGTPAATTTRAHARQHGRITVMAARRSSASAPPPEDFEENIVDIDVAEEMRGSYLEYALSVIYQRALPDARDGLQPVQRRILYQMNEMGLRPDRPHVKCARVVGDVMGRLHPHGDSAIYDALARMAQPWAMRLPLIDGHGNFGSIGGDDQAAAMRYTESPADDSRHGNGKQHRRGHRRLHPELRRLRATARSAPGRPAEPAGQRRVQASRSGWPRTWRRTT